MTSKLYLGEKMSKQKDSDATVFNRLLKKEHKKCHISPRQAHRNVMVALGKEMNDGAKDYAEAEKKIIEKESKKEAIKPQQGKE